MNFYARFNLKGQFKEIHTDKQLLISHCKHIYTRPEWGIESYCYLNEERELILNEECFRDLQISQKFKPFMFFLLDGDEANLIRYYRFQFRPNLLEFLGVNTQPGCERVQKAYEQDLKHRRKKLSFIIGSYGD